MPKIVYFGDTDYYSWYFGAPGRGYFWLARELPAAPSKYYVYTWRPRDGVEGAGQIQEDPIPQ